MQCSYHCVGVLPSTIVSVLISPILHPAFGPALLKVHSKLLAVCIQLNDIYAVANAVPAISLCAYGFITPGTPGGICWGLGLGITLYGMMYMFVHDGLVHKRFPVGPIAKVPYLKRVAAAHKMHHIDDFDGLPWGLFLGEQVCTVLVKLSASAALC